MHDETLCRPVKFVNISLSIWFLRLWGWKKKFHKPLIGCLVITNHFSDRKGPIQSRSIITFLAILTDFQEGHVFSGVNQYLTGSPNCQTKRSQFPEVVCKPGLDICLMRFECIWVENGDGSERLISSCFGQTALLRERGMGTD